MEKIVLLFALPVLAACAASAPDANQTAEADMLRGQVMGEPVSCVSEPRLKGHSVYGKNTILWRAAGDKFYRMDLSPNCRLRDDYALVHETTQLNLCRGDIIRIVDTTTGTEWGSCALTEFVPFDPEHKS